MSTRSPPHNRQTSIRRFIRLKRDHSCLIFEDLRPLKNTQFCLRSRMARILTTGIPVVFRGLEFESDAEIGQKGAFFKGLDLRRAERIRVPKSPQFCPLFRETALASPWRYPSASPCEFSSSPHRRHPQHHEILFHLTRKSTFSYTFLPKRKLLSKSYMELNAKDGLEIGGFR
jgi:hypothetical protein